nr:unnamed protein product [Spirometra erinaceieuropaei]
MCSFHCTLDLILEPSQAVAHRIIVEVEEIIPKKTMPPAPSFRAEECLAEGNIMTLVWQACPGFGIDHYTLELDDGAAGPFRVKMDHFALPPNCHVPP